MDVYLFHFDSLVSILRRLMVLAAAAHLDAGGNKAAMGSIAAAKVAAPAAALRVLDQAIQVRRL